MTFLFPLGLLGLIGIPVLILIYIIKNKYTEQVIASTYLWNLSEKFLKKRIPINKLAGIISLILQILAIILISLAAAHPILTIPNAANEYCFVLDGSGSMNIEMNGSTRFDVGKDKIVELIDKSMDGSKYTLIYAGNTTDAVYEDITDKDRAKSLLAELEVAYIEAPLSDAVNVAQEYFNEHTSALTYLVTDKSCEINQNVNIILVYSAAENYAVSDVEYVVSDGQLQVSGMAISYESNTTLNVEIYFDGSDELYDTKAVQVTKNEKAPFEFNCDKLEFEQFKVKIRESDGLMLDNEAVVYNVRSENMAKTLLVSDSPFFIRAALISAGHAQIEYIETKDYTARSGYGLYIFDSFMPAAMPDDGAVWFFNPSSSLAGANFSYQGEVVPRQSAVYSSSTATSVNTLLNGVSKRGFELAKYGKCGLNGSFYSLITCDGNPLVFAGTNVYGNREVVFAFDVKDSAPFAMSDDYISLITNFTSYSFPTVIEDTMFFSGDTLQINKIAGCDGIRIETPLGKVAYPDTSVAITEYDLQEVGVYTINLIMKDRSERQLNVYAAMPEVERVPSAQSEVFTISGAATSEKTDGFYDPLLIIFIILAVIIVADYGVYCYEQYQLR